MPKFWSENDFEIYLVKCPEGHDEVEIQKREIVPDSNNIRAYFRCKICYTKFIEQGIFIFNEESIEYEPPGVVSGKEVKGLRDYEKRKKDLRKKVFR